MDMTNETVGDAFSDMLIVETILCERGWSLSDWYGTYSDLPNRLTKVTVQVIYLNLCCSFDIFCVLTISITITIKQDRTIFVTSDAERICIKPPGLQEIINSIVLKYPMGRSFVR